MTSKQIIDGLQKLANGHSIKLIRNDKNKFNRAVIEIKLPDFNKRSFRIWVDFFDDENRLCEIETAVYSFERESYSGVDMAKYSAKDVLPAVERLIKTCERLLNVSKKFNKQ